MLIGINCVSLFRWCRVVPPHYHRSPADFSRLIDFERGNLVLLQGKLGLFFYWAWESRSRTGRSVSPSKKQKLWVEGCLLGAGTSSDEGKS